MISYNVKLLSNDSQYLITLLSEIKDCYNYISDIIYNHPNRNSLNIKQLHHIVYYPCRDKFPNIPSQTIIKSYKAVLANYRAAKRNKHTITKPFTLKNGCLRLDKRLYSNLTKSSIDLFSSVKNHRQTATFQLYPKVKELLSKYNVADPLIFVKDNELYISLSFNVPTPLPDNDDVLGVDRGIRRLIATSDGMIIKGSEYQKHKRRIRYNKKQLQSKGTKSARRRLKRQRRKERNFSNNYCHLVVNEVLKTDKGIIVLENLKGIKEKTKKHNNGYKRKEHNRRFSQIPLYKLEEILTYKAQHLGKKVETVSPKDTSKNDCRGLKNGKRVGCRYITVDNKQMDSDVNAAVNIGNKYLKHPILTYPDRIVPVGRLIVTEPIACQTPSGALQATNSLG